MSSIHSAREGYQRGVVLGLTLAEVMLILLFCLLLSAGYVLKKERDKNVQLSSILEESEYLSGSEDNGVPIELTILLKSLRKEKLSDRSIKEILESLRIAISTAEDGNPETIVSADFGSILKELIFVQSERLKAKEGLLTPNDVGARLRTKPIPPSIANDWTKLVRAKQILENMAPSGTDEIALLEQLQALLKSSEVELQELAKSPTGYTIVARQDRPTAEHDWPPIIRLSEADGYFFKLGSAELSEQFIQKLKDSVVPQLLKIIETYKVDVVEIVGHTDQVPLKLGLISNLDSDLLSVVDGAMDSNELVAADNAGLGFARAAAVVRLLRSDARLSKYSILPLSAAQLTNTKEEISERGEEIDVQERRRVEIRVRRRSPH